MAGSNVYVEYESDDGNTYLILANEANSKMIVGGGSMRMSKARTGNFPVIPANINPRGFYAYQANNLDIKKFLIAYRRDFFLNYWNIPYTDRYFLRDYATGSGRTATLFIPSGYKGESHRDITFSTKNFVDTGLNDGSI